jgi:hypothetical protein
MSMSQSLNALRRANPRSESHFAQNVGAATEIVRGRLATSPAVEVGRVRRRRVGVAFGAAVALVIAVAGLSTIGSSSRAPGVDDAAAAVKKAAGLSAASAERSGTAVVRITRDGEPWAGSTIRWNGDDLALKSDAPQRAGRAGSEMLVVGGAMFGIDPVDGKWVELGSTESVDPGSGTTPAEYLAAARGDVGGATLRRITNGMAGLTTSVLADGSTVYRGSVPARLIARETGIKEGRPTRVLPFGYVAHDDAADPDALLRAAVTVGPDGIIRELAVSWGGASAWKYAVSYGNLGATAPLTAPADARPLRRGSGRSGSP